MNKIRKKVREELKDYEELQDAIKFILNSENLDKKEIKNHFQNLSFSVKKTLRNGELNGKGDWDLFTDDKYTDEQCNIACRYFDILKKNIEKFEYEFREASNDELHILNTEYEDFDNYVDAAIDRCDLWYKNKKLKNNILILKAAFEWAIIHPNSKHPSVHASSEEWYEFLRTKILEEKPEEFLPSDEEELSEKEKEEEPDEKPEEEMQMTGTDEKTARDLFPNRKKI